MGDADFALAGERGTAPSFPDLGRKVAAQRPPLVLGPNQYSARLI